MADLKEETRERVEEPKDESAAFDAEKCEAMLAQGKRNLLCGEIPQSVNQLQEVCRLLAAKYGETAHECGDAYFQYGSALLELSRMESRVLGNALQGMTEDVEAKETEKDLPDDSFTVPSNITDAEKEKISEEIIDAMLEPDETPAADDAGQKSTESPDEKSAENLDEKSTENLDEKPTEKLDEISTDNQDEKAAENPDKKSTEKLDQKSADNPDEKATENPDEKPAENLPVDNAADATTDNSSAETEMVTEETGSAAETTTEAVAKQQLTDEPVIMVTDTPVADAAETTIVKASVPIVDEKGDAAKDDAGHSASSEKAVAATDTGAGDAQFKTVTPGRAQRVAAIAADDKTEAAETDDSEIADSDVENKLNPDEYEDDTTEFDQSEVTADDTQNEEEDVSNLQLAWEMLELAKNIYHKQEGADVKKKQAECLKKLGEVGLESEQYIQSIEDFKSSLEVLKLTVDDVKTDRSVAETHYHIGVACVYACCYDDGVTHFREAISILEAKNVALQAVISAADVKEGSEESDEVTAARSEMKEIAELIPDIRLKIEDAEEEKSSLHLKDVIKNDDGVTTIGFGSSDAATTSAAVIGVKPVDDVTHLVRKKRKPDDDEHAGDNAKKPKTVITEADSLADEPSSTPQPDGTPAAETVLNGCTASENASAEEQSAVVNGCDVGMDVTEDAEIKVKSVSESATTVDEPVAIE